MFRVRDLVNCCCCCCCCWRRISLLKAVSGLPAEDDDSWTVPEALLAAVSADAAEARRHVLTFGAWARAAVSQLPEVPREEMQATDFSDYYKLVMSRVQLIYGQATHSHEAELRFPSQPAAYRPS